MLALDDPTLTIYGDDDDRADDDVTLTDDELHHYYELWCNKSQFDFTISLNRHHTRHHAHERILRTNRYFSLLFRSKSLGTKRHASIDYDVITAHAFATLLEYLYTRTLALCDETVEEVCIASAYLMEGAALAYCIRHLTRCMTLEKAVKGLDLSLRHRIDDLKDKMLGYLVERFDLFVTSNCFTCASFDVVVSLVESSDLVVYNEDVVRQACCDWINHNTSTRQKHTQQLEQKLRVRFLTSPPHTTDQPCRKYWNGLYMITNDCIHHYNPERGDAIEITTLDCIPPRDGDVIVACDGNIYFISNEGALRCFDPRTKLMTSLAPLPMTSSPIEKFCACAHNRKLYIFSWYGIHIYTPATSEWEVIHDQGAYIDEDASINSISASGFHDRYILLGDCTFGGNTPLLLIDLHDNNSSSRVDFQLPSGYFYRWVAYERFLLFFGVTQSGAGSNILMVYDVGRVQAVCCELDGLFVTSQVRRRHFIFFFHRFKLERHGSHIYFIEEGTEKLGEYRKVTSIKLVDLNELVHKIWEPCFKFSSICQQLDVEIGLENFELLSL